ncbi:uncharacterized protein METZ01_LOCUS221922 [marine metagenome]|uniref:Uncharacterized protein n=1 Tax=marine metagenome TaxID=408172 RepID=A0A382G199_9ZZZZ
MKSAVLSLLGDLDTLGQIVTQASAPFSDNMSAAVLRWIS